MNTKLQAALQYYTDLQNRNSHPEGNFDKAGRWYPSDDEKQSCCADIRQPTRAYPYSLIKHCRSVQHIAEKFGVTPAELRRAYRQANPAKREGGENYYKLLAIHPETGKTVSIFNGETEYEIDKKMNGTARQDHQGGYYVYRTLEEALCASFPQNSTGENWIKVVARVKTEGNYCVYKNGKLAFSSITPLEFSNTKTIYFIDFSNSYMHAHFCDYDVNDAGKIFDNYESIKNYIESKKNETESMAPEDYVDTRNAYHFAEIIEKLVIAK